MSDEILNPTPPYKRVDDASIHFDKGYAPCRLVGVVVDQQAVVRAKPGCARSRLRKNGSCCCRLPFVCG